MLSSWGVGLRDRGRISRHRADIPVEKFEREPETTSPSHATHVGSKVVCASDCAVGGQRLKLALLRKQHEDCNIQRKWDLQPPAATAGVAREGIAGRGVSSGAEGA